MSSGKPGYVSFGAKDSSATKEITISKELGQVVLSSYAFAAKGPEKAVGSIEDLTEIYGEESFDEMSKYFLHSTRFIKRWGRPGSIIEYNRIHPDDIKNEANIVVYLDIIAADIPNYVRDSQGSYIVDSNTNEYKVDPNKPTIPGYRRKFITEYVSSTDALPRIGTLSSKNGTMKEGEKVSKMYPFLEARAAYKGSPYNLIGFGFNSPLDGDFDSEVMSELQSMLYGLTLYKKPTEKSSPVITTTLLQENSIFCTLKAKQVNPNTSAKLGFEEVFASGWYNTNKDKGTVRYPEIGGIHLYRDNLELILNLIKVTEEPHISSDVKIWEDGVAEDNYSWFDFTNEDLTDDEHLLNLFTCKSTKNVSYYSVIPDNGTANLTGNQKEINISSDTPIMLQGGSDGTISNEVLNKKVGIILAEYGDSNSPLLDPIHSAGTFFMDSGYDLDVKKLAFNMIAKRTDTAIGLCTYDYDTAVKGIETSMSDQLAILAALSARAQLAPESTKFGTECARAFVVLGSGELGDGGKELVPNTFEVLGYISDMMGSTDKKWKESEIFDDSCYTRELVNTTPKTVSNGMKQIIWDAGGIVPIKTDRGNSKFIVLQTLYPKTTSVMNNIFTMFAMCYSERMALTSWLDLSGNSRDKPTVFLSKVKENLNKKHNGAFAGMFQSVIKPELTEMDRNNGNSWTVVTELHGNVSKGTCFHNTNVFRQGDA